jgi:hypothetical protein
MAPDYKYLLDGNFSTDSRVWIYQSNRIFLINEALEIEEILRNFIKEWKSHGKQVKGSAHLLFGRFIILMADEKASGVSGCSTDSSVRMIKEIENQFKVNMFDRETLAFVVQDKIQLLPLSQLQYAFDNKFILADTLYFNNLVQTKEELETHWIIPVKESWLAKKISFINPSLKAK